MAGGVLFLPFLPMLPTQILLNNLLYDLSETAIPLDRVNDATVARPRRWDIDIVRKFMLVFGPVSSVFDFMTFGLLLWVFQADEKLFHTGWFVESIMVAPMGHFSGIAGAVALAVIVIPIVVRTTENMLLLVPNQLREAASAIGMTRFLVIRYVAYKAAMAGIIAGALLAIARISGETAPLLFTALNNQFFSTSLDAPMSSLPAVIFQFALSPYSSWQDLAWTGALLITAAVLTLSVIARWLSSRGAKS